MLVTVLIFVLSFTAAEEEGRREVEVKPGDAAALQCRGPRGAAVTLVEWIRPGIRSEPGSSGYVFFYRNGRSYENYQHPSFYGRVQLRDPEMKHGDVSVILKNVTANDTGTYECHVIGREMERSERKHTEVRTLVSLAVTGSGHTAGRSEEGGSEEGGSEAGAKVAKIISSGHDGRAAAVSVVVAAAVVSMI